jgi:Flp pilus assembly protein TadG
MTAIACLARHARRLRDETSGLALLEFALGMPVFLALGGYGVEVANLALTNMRISQYALQLADNASRIGVNSGLAVYQVREGDINDVLEGVRLFGASAKLTTYGRVTISSLENIQQSYPATPASNDTAPVQRIHWQRCIGLANVAPTAPIPTNFASSYGTTTVTDGTTATPADNGTDAPSGMGGAGSQVNAPAGGGVIFVEINYQYHPLFGSLFVAPTRLHYVASFIVRDKRDFSKLYNPGSTAVASTCNLHTA